jgi:alpha/beta superfamily hydrolase
MMKRTLIVFSALLFLFLLPANGQGLEGIEGAWTGALDLPGAKLTIVLRIAKAQDGALSATMDCLEQGAKGIPADTVSFDKGALRVTFKMINGTYEGRLENGSILKGTWTQHGAIIPLDLRRGETQAPARPQDPKKPYPYREEEVSYRNGKADATLAATLTIPEGNGPFPAVLLITGSGPQNRNEEIVNHRPFLVLADALTRSGIAVLRTDDRGVGKSTGKFEGATTFDFVEDARAGVVYLKTRSEVDAKRIGLVGHSEGAVIAPILASDSTDIAYIVMMAGTGVNGEKVIERQVELILRASGGDDKKVAESLAIQKKVFAVLKEEPDDAAASAKIRKILKSAVESEKGLSKEVKEALLDKQAKAMVGKWMRTFLALDPAEYLRRVRCPVLVLNGEKDLQVDPLQNVPPIKKALQEGGNGRYTARIFKDLNHLFQHCKTGAPREYGSIEETMSPEVPRTIAEWVLAQGR